ncbi:TlpA family protein disulfide reductase [Streptomyces sp. NPDC057877]|uniref:TlpA family protein disulfide reductase n=1 Tax=Streptomyces sp. NPDC057877 TaxID=3346269 RepID=UPI00367D33B8
MSAASRAPQRSNRPRRTRRRVTPFAAVAAVAALALTSCSSGGTSGGGGDTGFVAGGDGIDTVAKSGRSAAPDLSGETLEGEQLDIADYKGKIVVLNIWGSWCSPCRAEAKNLQTVYDDTKDQGVEFVGINTRDGSTGKALAFEEEFGITYPSLYDPTGKLMLRFAKGTLNPQAIPSTLVLDRDGKIAARTLQALSEKKLREMLDPVLAEK